jgi:hypothetical protein
VLAALTVCRSGTEDMETAPSTRCEVACRAFAVASTNKATPTFMVVDAPMLTTAVISKVELALTGVIATDRTSSPSVIECLSE